MSYTKTNWTDRAVQYPNRFTLVNNGDGTYTLTPAPGTVTQTGTPISATNLNKIEQGVLDANTPSVLLDYIKTVDGAGSGLDADLVRGKVAVPTTVSLAATGANLNTVTDSGFYRLGGGTVNAPSGGVDYGQLIVCRGADTIFQIAADYGSNSYYMRSGNPADVGGNGSWQPWRRLWHDGNINPVNKTGDTMTGTLTQEVTSGNVQVIKLAGQKSFVIHHPSGGSLIFAPSASINGEDWDWPKAFAINDNGSATIAGNTIWHTNMLRDNGTNLEYYTGGAWRAVGGMKKVQRGSSAITAGAINDITISPVVVDKSVVHLTTLAWDGNEFMSLNFNAVLLNSTTIRCTATGPSNASVDFTWQVAEYY